MNKKQQRYIEVCAHWVGMSQPILVGTLWATPSRGKEIFSFEYAPGWLENNLAQALDPSLQLIRGVQYPTARQENFSIFLDSSPDRWGRFLMDRRAAQRARIEENKESKLVESDYLLGVCDDYRMGALRFRVDPAGDFLDNDKEFAAPPFASLRELEHASLALETMHDEEDPRYSTWLQMLIAPGGSLGGARPKASIVDEKNHLWIAKFPSVKDDFDVGAWEMVAYLLAKQVGIVMAESKIMKFNNPQHTFLSKRFDRNEYGERIHFSSAMTLLQRTDGDDVSTGASYLELAEIILQHSPNVEEDLEQLWRRIVYSICISNTDDHLRNHGFVLQPDGWRLSPAFDINPVFTESGLKLNISESDNSQDLSLALEVIAYFRIKAQKANQIIQDVVHTVKNWRTVAKSVGISGAEQKQMSNAFRVTLDQ